MNTDHRAHGEKLARSWIRYGSWGWWRLPGALFLEGRCMLTSVYTETACARGDPAYTGRVKFFAPQAKRSANIVKHGYDPADFEAAFSFDRYLSRRTKPSLTGRTRMLLIGKWFGDDVVTVIVSPLGTEAWDVVSVRDASEKERAAYDEL